MAYFKKVMSHPLSILAGIGVGAYIGIYHQAMGKSLAPWGKLYLSALQMTIIPYVVVTLSSSIARLLGSEKSQLYIKRILLIFFGMLVMVSLMGLLCGTILKPGVLDRSEMSDIMKMTGFTPSRTISTTDPIEKDQAKGLVIFITESIPSNIFDAFAKGEVLQIVFFTLIFGVALGVSPEGIRKQAFPLFETLRETFQIIIRTIVLLLPVGVMALFADQLSSISASTFMAMLKFLLMGLCLMVVVLALFSLIIWFCSGVSYFKSLYAMRDTFFITLSTRNSLVSMPSAIENLTDNLKFNRELVELVMPLGISICRFGNVGYFSFATLFIAQIYNTPLGGADYVIILVGAVLAGLTTSGASGIATLPMLTLILDPLGLPLGAVLVLFVAIDPIIDPFRALAIVYGNCASTALIIGKTKVDSSDSPTGTGPSEPSSFQESLPSSKEKKARKPKRPSYELNFS